MTASVTTLPADVELDEVVGVVAEDGGVIVRGMLAPDVIERFRSDIVSEVEDHQPGATTGNDRTVEFRGSHTKRFTRLVPGSHLWDDYDRKATPDEFATAEMGPGDGLIYSGRVIHNGGANVTTDEWRLGLHVSFVLGWLTPEEALPISVPWSAAKEMSDRAQRLLG